MALFVVKQKEIRTPVESGQIRNLAHVTMGEGENVYTHESIEVLERAFSDEPEYVYYTIPRRNLYTIAVSHGTYGINGIVMLDEMTGKLYGSPSRTIAIKFY